MMILDSGLLFWATLAVGIAYLQHGRLGIFSDVEYSVLYSLHQCSRCESSLLASILNH